MNKKNIEKIVVVVDMLVLMMNNDGAEMMVATNVVITQCKGKEGGNRSAKDMLYKYN